MISDNAFVFQAFFILGGSLLSEGATLIMAINAIRQGAARHNMSFSKYSQYFLSANNFNKSTGIQEHLNNALLYSQFLQAVTPV